MKKSAWIVKIIDFFTGKLYSKTIMEQFSYKDLNVVYEDNHVIVVVKPQNIPSCPD